MTPHDRPDEVALPRREPPPPSGGDPGDAPLLPDPEAPPTINPVTGQPSVGDYTRDLQLEYEQEQEEGKV